MARPEKWKDEFVRIAEGAAKLGATDREVAEMLGISERTLNNWKHTRPELVEALRVGKDAADQRVESSLYHRAVGYTFDSEKVFQFQGQIVRTATKEHIPPDTTAAIFWLKNRKPGEWRDVRTIEGTVNHQLAGLTDDELATIALGGGEGIADAKGRAH